MLTRVKCCPVPDNDVDSGIDAPQRSVAALGQPIRRFIGGLYDDQEIVVAIRSRIPSGAGTKEIDALRVQSCD